MPSEKSRYLRRNLGPPPPLNVNELRDHLGALGADQLAELVWSRSQYDDVLRKTLMVSVAARMAHGNWDKAKAAVDYALHFPDYVRYTERGHGQILREIEAALEFLVSRDQLELALCLARYTIARGQEVAENFEDDWDWTSSLKSLAEWAQKSKSAKG